MYMMAIEDRKLVKKQTADPVLKPGEILVKVAAAAVNRADLMQVDGNYPPPPDWPEWPGLEIAGEVVRTCPGSAFRPGDRVCALLGGGGYAEYCAVPETMVLACPENLTPAEAAGIPEVFSTVWLNFMLEAGMKGGETVFVQAGASGLGLAAIQVAKLYACRIVTTVGSEEKAAFVRSLGADVVVNRKTGDLGSALDENPPDIVLDCVGGPDMGKNFVKMAPWGRWIQVASLAGSVTEIPLDTVFRKRIRLIGSTLRSRTNAIKGRILHDLQSHLWPAFADGRLKSVIHAVFPLEQANGAHEILRRNANTGKVILTLD